jgi:NitT/TauT family transport system permease protein
MAMTPSAGGETPPAQVPDPLPAAKQKKGTRKNPILEVFLPNRVVSKPVLQIIAGIQVAIFIVIWSMSPFEVLPRPGEVFGAFHNLWFEKGLGDHLIRSATLNIKALLWTTFISLGLSYLTVIPFFRPMALLFSKGRFLSMVGFSAVLTIMLGGGEALKLPMLVFGMTVFFLTSMADVVATVPREAFDHARTLRMSEPRVVWEVVIRGTADKAFEVMRQNAAIGWMMLTMVEGISRGSGGIGVLLLTQQKYFKLADVFAIQIAILVLGIFQDYIIGALRRLFFPYADLKLERR